MTTPLHVWLPFWSFRYEALASRMAIMGDSVAEIFVRISTLQSVLGMFDKALLAANRALSIDECLPVAYYRKGVALFGLERYAHPSLAGTR